MKRTFILGLVVVAALAFTAIAGATSAIASKTVLCKASGTYCSEANTYASGTTLKATSSNVKIETDIGTVSCSESTLEGKTSAASGEPLAAEISSWSVGGCKTNGSCQSSAAEHLPASGSIAHSSGSNGTLSLKGSGGEVGWYFKKCGTNFSCHLNFEPTLSATGGNPATLSVNQSMKSNGGLVCPSASTFTATFTVSSPQPLYVEVPQSEEPHEEGVVLCSANEEPCGHGNVYASGTKFEASLAPGTEAVIEDDAVGVRHCSSSSLGGETTAEAAEPLPAKITSFGLSGCVRGGESCTITPEGVPYTAAFGPSLFEPERRLLVVDGLKFHMNCGSTISCTLRMQEAQFELSGGSPATLRISESLELVSGTLCGKNHYFEATYQVNSPKPLYLTYNY
jgi:hypothetical protein